jgi:DEAD/DEAH box helicase domain-containing protein
MQNPAFILDNFPEQPLINPHNPLILFNQLRCAAYELPFKPGDSYGSLSWDELKQYLDVLCIKGDLIEKEQRYFWIGEAYPSAEISIRSISTAAVDLLVKMLKVQQDVEVDSESVLWMAHPSPSTASG